MSQNPDKLMNIVGCFFALGEASRTILRELEVRLPLEQSVESYYYQHCGDFCNGYCLSILAHDIIKDSLGKISNWSKESIQQDSKLAKIVNALSNPHLANLLSGASSASVVVVAEKYGILNTPDPKDIPAGVAGALIYVGLRYILTRNHKEIKFDEAIS